MNEKSYTVLGIMSGTSLDGLDLALCQFSNNGEKQEYKVIAAETVKYNDNMKKRLENAIEESAYGFAMLNVDLGRFIAFAANNFLAQQKIKPTIIASHGHTTFHQPVIGLTSQIGSGAVIAAKTGITTVCDFRTVDVALGGQGAPLVPIGDELLFGKYDACLNLGGISNISFRKNGTRIAFDVSPCNMALNFLANKLNLNFDKDGENARKGNIDNDLLQSLNNIGYYKKNGAKSLGKEWFDNIFKLALYSSTSSVLDKLRTVTEHIAIQISTASKGEKGETMLVTGGGAHNKFLIERISQLGTKKIIVPDDLTIDFKEAIIFAFLGMLRVRGENNCLKAVTGAETDNCGGAIYLGKI